jgi:pimeloyl-ACP methyl ester carboxylesterase
MGTSINSMRSLATDLISVYTSPAGEAETMNSYKAIMDQWRVDYDELTVSTRFGETHVIATGPPDAPPVVLLHALFATATSWYLNVERLSASFRIYSVDVIGEANRSRPTRPIASLDDFLLWFIELLDGLGIENLYVVGNSYGGFTGAYYAMKLPERIRKLVLISPAATIHKMTPFMFHMFVPKGLYLLFPRLPGLRRAMRRSVDWMHAGLPRDPLWEPLFYRSMVHGKLINRVFPRLFSKEEFSAIRAPVLLLFGDKEAIYGDLESAIRSARDLIPNVEIELIPNAHHIAAIAQPELVNQRILRFFGDELPNAGSA